MRGAFLTIERLGVFIQAEPKPSLSKTKKERECLFFSHQNQGLVNINAHVIKTFFIAKKHLYRNNKNESIKNMKKNKRELKVYAKRIIVG